MHALFKLALLTGLLICLPTHAVILDEEDKNPPKPAVKPKPRGKNEAELEIERLKKELAASKRKQNQAQDDDPAQSGSSGGPRIEMVTLPTGILMSKTEITQGQWQVVMGDNPSEFFDCGETCPVEYVSWDDVQKFIQRLNQMTGQRYRLPSEGEWLAACKAGNNDSKYCGSNNIDTVAWHHGNSGNTTHTVGQKQPNAWGLYDMSGNVSEWTNSCYENDCAHYVIRGGHISYSPSNVGTAIRDFHSPSSRSDLAYVGFRLARDR